MNLFWNQIDEVDTVSDNVAGCRGSIRQRLPGVSSGRLVTRYDGESQVNGLYDINFWPAITAPSAASAAASRVAQVHQRTPGTAAPAQRADQS